MNIIITETDINKQSAEFARGLKENASEEVNLISNPIQSYCHSFKKNNKQYTVLGIRIKAFPLYYLFFISLFLFFLYPNIFFTILLIICTIISFPFTTLFWQMLYIYGIKKKGYRGKIKFLTTRQILKVILWDK